MPDEPKTPADEILDTVRELDGKQKERADALETVNADLTQRLTDLEEKTRARLRGPEGGDEGKPKPITISRLCHAIATGDWARAGYERECVQESRTALAGGTDSLGGYLIAEQYLPEQFIGLIRKNTVVFEAGARHLTGLVGSPVEMGKQTGAATAYWGTENTAITESNPTFGNVGMVPHPLTGLVKMSNMLLRMGNPSVEQLVQEDLARVLGLKLDLAAMKGVGGTEPVGISETPGINTKSMNATVTLALMEDMVYAQDSDDTLTGNSVFVMHTREWNTIRGLLLTAGITWNSWGKGISKELMGYRVLTTNQLSITNASDEGDIFFGNFTDLIVGEWGSIEFMASQEAGTAFAANQTWIRAIQLVDVAVRQPLSFCYTVDARI